MSEFSNNSGQWIPQSTRDQLDQLVDPSDQFMVRHINDSIAEVAVNRLLPKLYVKGRGVALLPQIHLSSFLGVWGKTTMPNSEQFAFSRKNRLMSVDYLVTTMKDDQLSPLLVLEIDGPSHWTDEKQIVNDLYKQSIITGTGIPLMRVKADSKPSWLRWKLLNVIEKYLTMPDRFERVKAGLEPVFYYPPMDDQVLVAKFAVPELVQLWQQFDNGLFNQAKRVVDDQVETRLSRMMLTKE